MQTVEELVFCDRLAVDRLRSDMVTPKDRPRTAAHRRSEVRKPDITRARTLLSWEPKVALEGSGQDRSTTSPRSSRERRGEVAPSALEAAAIDSTMAADDAGGMQPHL